MDWLQFISSIVQSLVSLAWPAAFVAAVWLFREKSTALLPLLRFKYKDLPIRPHVSTDDPAAGADHARSEERDRGCLVVSVGPEPGQEKE
jgi:hypothetical protein